MNVCSGSQKGPHIRGGFERSGGARSQDLELCGVVEELLAFRVGDALVVVAGLLRLQVVVGGEVVQRTGVGLVAGERGRAEVAFQVAVRLGHRRVGQARVRVRRQQRRRVHRGRLGVSRGGVLTREVAASAHQAAIFLELRRRGAGGELGAGLSSDVVGGAAVAAAAAAGLVLGCAGFDLQGVGRVPVGGGGRGGDRCACRVVGGVARPMLSVSGAGGPLQSLAGRVPVVVVVVAGVIGRVGGGGGGCGWRLVGGPPGGR